MIYGICELDEIYSFWKKELQKKSDTYAVSFNSLDKGPLIFTGLEMVQSYLGKKVFSIEEVRFLHSLVNDCGKLLYDDQFIQFISDLTFEFEIESILEGSIFFSGQPILKVKGNALILTLVKKLITHYLPRQIGIATEVEKITSYICPAPLIAQNLKRTYESKGELDVKSAYIGGANATEDLYAASKFHIPVCYHETKNLKFIDLSKPNHIKEIMSLKPTDSFILKGVSKIEDLEGIVFEKEMLKGVSVDISSMNFDQISVRFHNFLNQEILDPEFRIYRFSHKGLFTGDLITKEPESDLRKTLFGKYISTLRKEDILVNMNDVYSDTLDDKKRRVLKNMRLLPLRYRSGDEESIYPVRIMKRSYNQEALEVTSTKLA